MQNKTKDHLSLYAEVVFANLMTPAGVEPATYCLEGSCSIRLSYEVSKSGWQDSNLRPPHPKCGAITGLRYTPNTETKNGGEWGIRTPGPVTRSRFSKPLL